jgi:hypothetical protein
MVGDLLLVGGKLLFGRQKLIYRTQGIAGIVARPDLDGLQTALLDIVEGLVEPLSAEQH